MSENETRSIGRERVARMRASLNEVVAPLKEDVAEITKSIEQIEQEIADYRLERMTEISELRDARREAIQLIRIADPEFEKQVRTTKTRSQRGFSNGMTNVTRETLTDFLRDHHDELVDGFNTWSLNEHRDLRLNKTTIGRALEVFRREGIIRLDRVGYLGDHKKGRESRIYKLTETK